MQIYANKQFDKPLCILKAFNNKEFKKVFELLEIYRENYYILGYVRYEAKDVFLNKEIISELPLCYFEVFDCYKEFIPPANPAALLIKTEPMISKECYFSAISDIKKYIEKGYTYEVNYTYPLKVMVDGAAMDIYNWLLKNQTTPYNAFIKNDYEEVLSFSPELFFRLEENKILTKPMKGTIQRGLTKEEDIKNIEFLKNDEKNRAENVMIVDLLRNDLGRIAKTGTVKADKLFEIETHRTLHQMTSEISAELETTGLYEIFNAIFPCGSITGAPKISTMKIIEALEIARRGIYCGAIGLISPEECVFSVPIRVLQKQAGDGFYTYHAGGAIVWDSTAEEEWKETITKRKFLETLPDFKLLETMKCENGKILFESEHISRITSAAVVLGFKLPERFDLPADKNGMLRLLLDRHGGIEVQALDLTEAKTNKVVINPHRLMSNELFLKYKTTYRPWYERSICRIKNAEVYDEIFFNERNEVAEGARSNIVIEKNGEFFTPPLSSGILNGIYRQKLIDGHFCIEKVLYKKDLDEADRVYCVNSVRGMVEVFLDTNR